MESQKQNLDTVTVEIPSSLELFQLTLFLKEKGKLPFHSCIYTTKPAEKGQFTLQKTFRQIINQCKKISNDYILLCYQSTIQSNIQNQDQIRSSKINQTEKQDKNNPKNFPQISQNKKQNFKKQKAQNKEENDCFIF